MTILVTIASPLIGKLCRCIPLRLQQDCIRCAVFLPLHKKIASSQIIRAQYNGGQLALHYFPKAQSGQHRSSQYNYATGISLNEPASIYTGCKKRRSPQCNKLKIFNLLLKTCTHKQGLQQASKHCSARSASVHDNVTAIALPYMFRPQRHLPGAWTSSKSL